MTNFTACAQLFSSDPVLQAKWAYDGPVQGITRNRSTQITLEGCKAVCGTGNDLYPWAQASATITTWILPIIGILLQAPFESNAFWKTVLAIGRWMGSPMASLSYVLWNMKVTAKCALMGNSPCASETQRKLTGRSRHVCSLREPDLRRRY